MVKSGKLHALQTQYELEEQNALEEMNRVAIVVAERRGVVESLVSKRVELEEELGRLRGSQRQKALQSGNSSQLASIARFEKLVVEKLSVVENNLVEKEAELKRALDREESAEKNLVLARIERRKVEKVIENRQRSARVIDAAREEAMTDEMNFYLNKNK